MQLDVGVSARGVARGFVGRELGATRVEIRAESCDRPRKSSGRSAGVTVDTRLGAALRTALFLLFAVVLVVFSPVHVSSATAQVSRSVSSEHKTEHGVPRETEKLRKRSGVVVLVRRAGEQGNQVLLGKAAGRRTSLTHDRHEDCSRVVRAVGSRRGLCESAHSQARLQVYRR
ncbi:hypothetical protein SAMN04489718_0217 [Actinopolyspora saharensis]|uniref:Transmembrane protein n=1 Tax=Actinopolyspora saharensis TaxID=995062 RepID=A0A1H0Y4F5_9ACTN|nr:hypothetical protein SAMN04489718_0217 [Actinopolyspora saharensis]